MHLRLFSEPRLLLTLQQQSHDERILHGPALDHGSYCKGAGRCRLVSLLGHRHRVSEGPQGQYCSSTRREKPSTDFSMLFEPSLHGFFIAKFDVCDLAITSTDRTWEIHSRDLHPVQVLAIHKSPRTDTYPVLCLPEKVPQHRLRCGIR